uniref:4-coumarate--CoA ligase n=1 Tax=Oryza punctata TaxID=4537 RepID=A0A0E0MB80_ORYPU
MAQTPQPQCSPTAAPPSAIPASTPAPAASTAASTLPCPSPPTPPSPSSPTSFARLPLHLHHHSLLVDAATAATLSCADLRRLVSSLAAALRHRLHIAKGSLVLLLLPNSVTFPIAFLAVLATGAVATTMNPSSAPAEIAARLRDTAPSLVLASTHNAAKLPPLAAPLVLVPDTFQQLEADDQFDLFYHALLDPDPAGAETPEVDVGQDDAAAVLYSSGTSGRSKGVVLTHRNLIAMVELFVRFEASQYTRPACDNVYLAALPMFHVYGLSLFAVGLLSLGCTVVVMRRFHVGDAVRAIRRYKVTHLPLVPPIMSALLRAKAPLESLLQVSSGAAPLNSNLIHDFLHAFPHVDFIQGYGMTESTAVGTRGFNTCNHNKYASVGYLNDDDDAFTIKDGWLRTGDIAYFDSDGYLFIVGRLKDTIKYKGFQIAPADLEAVLIRHPEIVDVAVTSDEDEEAGEIPVAFVVRKSGSTLSCTHVMEYVGKQVASYKRVRKVIFVEAIPKSAAGKVLRRLLKDSLVDASSGRSRL